MMQSINLNSYRIEMCMTFQSYIFHIPMFLQSCESKRPLRHRLGPVYYGMALHAVVLLQTLPPHSSSVFFKRTREKPIFSGGALKKRICSGDPYPMVP